MMMAAGARLAASPSPLRAAAITTLLVAAVVVVTAAAIEPAHGQITSGGFGDSPFERDFGDIKFLDAYFGTPDEKIEIEAGDENVPFTVVFANVGTQDITGIRGQLSLPHDFEPAGGLGTTIYADSDTNSDAGDNFSLTFFVSISPGADIREYPGAVKVDYSRLRESGVRTAFANFDFRVTGDTVVNARAVEPFLTSLRTSEISIQIVNDGTAPLAGVEVTAANTQTERATTASSITNVENVVLSESSWDLGRIGPGSSSLVTTTVYVPETLRGETLRIPLEVTYYNAHGDRIVISKIVDFFVKGLIDLSVFNVGVIEISGSPMIIGEIINEGNEDGLFGFVHVVPLEGSNLRPASQFIDEIETDAPVPFNIPVEFEGEPRYGSHEVRIDVRYKDGIREEHVLSHDALVSIPIPPPLERSPFDLIGGGADGGGADGGGADGLPNPLAAIITDDPAVMVAVMIAVMIAVALAAWRIAARRRRHADESAEEDSDISLFAKDDD